MDRRTLWWLPGVRVRFPWPVILSQSAVTVRGLARGPQVVRLRPMRRSDKEEWWALRGAEDARLTPWEATLPEDAGERLRSFVSSVRHRNRLARRGEEMLFALEVDGALAGQVSVAPISWGAVRTAGLGYWIGSAWEGRGVMTLALSMTLDHLLGPQVGLHRVEVNVRPENRRSLAVCRGLGLREEGLRRSYMHVDGRWADHLSFAVVAEDPQAREGFVRRLG